MQVQVTITGDFEEIFENILEMSKKQQSKFLVNLSEIDKKQILPFTFKKTFFKLFGPDRVVKVDADIRKL